MAVRSWDELRLLRLARRVFTVVKKKKKATGLVSTVSRGGFGGSGTLKIVIYVEKQSPPETEK